MVNGLTEATLAEVCSLVTDGTHDTPKRVESGYPLIKAKEITGGRIDFETCDQISEEDHLEVIARSKPEFGDTLFAHIGASLGEAAFVNTTCEFSIKNVALFKPNPGVIDARYLYYLVISPAFQSLAKGTKTGSAQPFLGLNQLRVHRIQYHRDLPTQRRIAGILSAYDDLIENSQRRIRILEAMARAFYREWFVHFRFPGHEKLPRVASPLADIPQGWEVKKLGELISVDKGVSYNGAGLTEDGNPMVNLKNIRAGGGFRRDATKPYSGDFKPRHTVKLGDVVLANTDLTQAGHVVASPALIPRLDNGKPILISHHLYAVRPAQEISPLFFYHLMLTEDFRGFAKGFAIGTTVLGLPKEGVLNYAFACPPLMLIRNFVARVSAMHEMIEALYERSENLRRTRDLLLPRLLSGQIDVEAA